MGTRHGDEMAVRPRPPRTASLACRFFPLAGLGNVLLHRQGFVPGMARGSGGRHAGDQIWRSIWPSRTLGQVCEAGRVWLSTAPRRTHRIASQRLETPTQTEPDISAAPTRCHVRRGR